MRPKLLSTRQLHRVWGSESLAPWFVNTLGQKVGEVWFETTPDLPLLVKFVITTEKLSVQVHPDDAYARRQGHPRGKTEMWHVLEAEPGAKIAAGFREPITRERLRQAALSGEIMDLLAWHEARPGDTFFIPAGTVHAIGEGLKVCEIQQDSDITYRLYDYGRPRELHLDHAVAVSDLGPRDVRRTSVECDYFSVEKVHVDGGIHLQTGTRQELWVVIEGRGTIAGSAAQAGQVWRVPVGPSDITLTGRLTLLRALCLSAKV